jgi:hypothetical protein
MGDPAVTERHPAGAVRHQHGVFRAGHFDIVERHVLHQLRGVDALLVARSDQVVERHARDRDDRRAVHVCAQHGRLMGDCRRAESLEECGVATPHGGMWTARSALNLTARLV